MDVLVLVLCKNDVGRAGWVGRAAECLGPAKNHGASRGTDATSSTVVVPLEAVLAAVDEGVVGGVDGRGDLGELGVTRIDGRHVVASCPAEGGEDFVAVGPCHHKELVRHRAAEGDAAPTGTLAILGSALLFTL